jgi:dipeptidyl-peptidase-4
MSDFPEQLHRTRRFTAGIPTDFTPSATDVLFLRDKQLLRLDLATGKEILIAEGVDRYTAEPLTYGDAPDLGPFQDPKTSPDGRHMLLTRVDEERVATWYLDNPAEPAQPPRAIRYPAVGQPNPAITLWLRTLDGEPEHVDLDTENGEYILATGWDRHGPYAISQSRDQRTIQFVAIDPGSGRTTVLVELTDDRWVHPVPGLPARTHSGHLLAHTDAGGTRYLTVDGATVTPPGLQLRELLSIDGDDVLFTASTEPTETHLYLWNGNLRQLSHRPGVHSGVLREHTLVHVARHGDVEVTVHRDGQLVATIETRSERPVLPLYAESLKLGPQRLRAALYLPSWHRPGQKLPVLLDPYGGAGMQRVTAAWDWRCHVSQWFAEQGFAVLVADGRGTPGRGPDWERAVYNDLFGPVLEDQLTALQEAAAGHPDLDLNRVGIRGWSFSGALAAYAVLRRPDVVRVAVAGAGVADQRLYNAQWRERFVGEDTNWYEKGSLIAAAPQLARPLLLIHGLDDDNVHPVNTLRLSAALLAAGRPHEVLLLPGIGHHAIGSAVTRQLLEHEARFLLTSL